MTASTPAAWVPSTNEPGGSNRLLVETDPDAATRAGPLHSADGRVRLLHYPDGFTVDDRVVSVDLRTRSYSDAVALPMDYDARTGGVVYDARGRLVGDSRRWKRTRQWRRHSKRIDLRPKDGALRLPGRSFFGGHYFPWFGHFLLETLGRFWPDLPYDEFDRVVLYRGPASSRRQPRLLGVEQDLLCALGIPPERIDYLGDQPVVFDELTVSSPPFGIKEWADRRLVAAHDRIGQTYAAEARTRCPPVERVYLSRAKLPGRKRVAVNEHAIEELMHARGFRVVHPETLPIKEQVMLVREANAIAGCDGSALHLAAFARPGTRVLALDSRMELNQFALAQARELDAVHVLATDSAPDETSPWTADLDRVAQGLELLLDTTGG